MHPEDLKDPVAPLLLLVGAPIGIAVLILFVLPR
jgi:hypothetical protein